MDKPSNDAPVAEARPEIKSEWIWRCQLCGARFGQDRASEDAAHEHAWAHAEDDWHAQLRIKCGDGMEIFDEINAYEDLLERLAGDA